MRREGLPGVSHFFLNNNPFEAFSQVINQHDPVFHDISNPFKIQSNYFEVSSGSESGGVSDMVVVIVVLTIIGYRWM